jgi:hypothetical protein
MPGMAMPAPSQGGSESSEGLTAANNKMMKDMDVKLTGNADRDFVAMMMPHHQGAVDMAEVELKYGRDPQLKKLARDIVAAQRKEIAFMQKWQASHAQQQAFLSGRDPPGAVCLAAGHALALLGLAADRDCLVELAAIEPVIAQEDATSGEAAAGAGVRIAPGDRLSRRCQGKGLLRRLLRRRSVRGGQRAVEGGRERPRQHRAIHRNLRGRVRWA